MLFRPEKSWCNLASNHGGHIDRQITEPVQNNLMLQVTEASNQHPDEKTLF
jgi:hypothetical protein